jgi:hypothetical protein
MGITLQNYNCLTDGHIGKVIKEGYNLIDGQMIFKVELYGCTKCEATSPKTWQDSGITKENPDHIDSELCLCFGCKARTLQLSPGDAAGNKGMSNKKWDAELNLYKSAREQGIQPAGTSTKLVQKAIDDSNKVGKAYDANTNSFKG